ncbi:hypothetical protein [Neiella marina]|uniref:hypothetical protein n=1 Tax=Neiella marina TaxID=508461 RepID=UPI000B3D4BB0|nr:hypothetical protein [Neiella marina]
MQPLSNRKKRSKPSSDDITEVLSDELKAEYFYRWKHLMSLLARRFAAHQEPLAETIESVTAENNFARAPSPKELMSWRRRWFKDGGDLRIQIIEDAIRQGKSAQYAFLLRQLNSSAQKSIQRDRRSNAALPGSVDKASSLKRDLS